MFLRLLFVLLIALNIAVGAWLLLGPNDVRYGPRRAGSAAVV
jgi:hypothetical protein